MVVPPIAIYGAAATSYTLAKELYVLVKDICDYHDDLKELGNQYNDNKLKFDIMFTTFQEISNHVDPELRSFVAAMNQHLSAKLEEAKIKLQKSKQIQWSFVKNGLTLAVGALSEWVNRFALLYVLLPDELKQKFQEKTVSPKFKVEGNGPLAALYAHIEMKATQLELKEEDADVVLATMSPEPRDTQTRDIRRFRYLKDIIDIPSHIQYDEVQLRSFKLEVARLAAVLKAANPNLTHLPKAVSWFERRYPTDTAPHAFGIAYEVYENMILSQRSLKDTINLGPPEHTLNDRLQLALDFVSAMAYLRGLQWVHKAVRSTNILLNYTRNDGAAPAHLGHVNLVGFCVARRGTGDLASNSRDNELHWRDEVYRHPDRQTVSIMDDDLRAARESRRLLQDGSPPGPAARRASGAADPRLPYYRYVHDIYSIGVVLLEIGLWRDLTPDGSGLETAPPVQRRDILLQMARDGLPKTLGRRYAELVKRCLEADDEGPGVPEILSELAKIQV